MEVKDIAEEVNKCLNCKIPQCKKGCPMSTEIPKFISLVKEDKIEEAFYVLRENNILSDVCCNVCPVENQCMGNCIKGVKGEPVKISKIEKFVNNWARENNVKYKPKQETKNNIPIAVIGSGPAGISCAVELAKKGFEVTIFEKEKYIGGLLTYGIPGFRLPRNITDNITETLIEMGIKIRTNMEFGKDKSIKDLFDENFKAIFIGVGAGIPLDYELTKDKECKGIYKSDYFLKEYNEKRIIKGLGRVGVIGGGNVAIDSARAAIRMGADNVTIYYRRSKSRMPAREEELQAAIKDGVKIIYNTKVCNAITEENSIIGINCVKTDDETNEIEGSQFSEDLETVIFAIGFFPDTKLLEQQKLKVTSKKLEINEDGMTNIDGVFAGGDVTEGKSTVCKAIAAGKKGAIAIQKYIEKIYK